MGLAAVVLCVQCIDCYVNQMQQDLADVTVSVWVLLDKTEGEKYTWLFRRVCVPLDLATYFSQYFFGIKRNTQKNENINSSHGLILTGDSIPCLPHQTADACQLVVTTPFEKIIWLAVWRFPEGKGREGEVEKGRGSQTYGDRKRSDLGW